MCLSGTIKLFRYGPVHVPRPRLHETTVAAIEKTANEMTEFDAGKFDTDTQIRLILHKHAAAKVNNSRRHPLKQVLEWTDPYDVSGE